MALATTTRVLIEQNVENPVQVVLDAPMGAHDLEHLGLERTRCQKVSCRVLKGFAGIGFPTVDAANAAMAGKPNCFANCDAEVTMACRRSVRP